MNTRGKDAIQQDLETAMELSRFFSTRGISPPDSLLAVAALHANFIIQAQKEGKPATIADYARLYQGALEMYLSLLESLSVEGPVS